jgi:hypothetical protein
MFCYCQSVINFDAEISDRAFDLGVAKRKLGSPEIAGAPVNQGSLRASERMRSEKSWVQPNVSIGVEIACRMTADEPPVVREPDED